METQTPETTTTPKQVLLHLVDPRGPGSIYSAVCGLRLTSRQGDPHGQWWWHDEGHHSARIDLAPSPNEVAVRDSLELCATCVSGHAVPATSVVTAIDAVAETRHDVG